MDNDKYHSITKDEILLLKKIFKELYLSKIGHLNKYIIKKNIDKELINFSSDLSYIDTYIKFLIIYNDIHLHPINTICTILKITRNKKQINYAYLYGYINKENKIINKYVIISNSLISKDGEYKYKFLDINKIDILFKDKNNNIIDEIYDYLSKEILNKDFKLTTSIFNLNNNKKKSNNSNILKNYKNIIENNSLLLKIYMHSWITELIDLINNNQPINMNEMYNNIMFSNKDIKYFTHIYNKYKKSITEYNNNLIYYKYNVELGQKLIPFDYIQLKEYNNIIHFQWKELLINKIITNLIYNMNSPCFPIFSNFIMLQDINKNLFDNPEIYKKLSDSENIKIVLDHLSIVNNDLIQLKSKTDKTIIIKNLLSKLKKMITISETNMLMSNTALCYFSEFNGKTIYDYLNKSYDITKISPHIGNLYMDYEIFSKYIFEIIYSLYCLNLKGIIHGDLHLNNITLKENEYIKSDIQNNYILYDINNNLNNNIIKYLENPNVDININTNNNELYIFKHLGCYPSIIDFSRSFVLLKLIDENIIEKEKNKIRKKFIKNERKRIIHELNKIFPNYIKNNYHKLKFLFKDINFSLLYIYFTAYDIFTFSTNLLICLKKISTYNNVNINIKILDLLTNISKKAYFYLEKIIDEHNYNTTDITHKFPNYLIIKEFFSEFIFNNDENYNIIGIFNINKIKDNKDIKLDLKKYLNLQINNKNYNINEKNDIYSKFSYILNYEYINDELEIEKLINNEYYKLKHNLKNIDIDISSTDDFSFNTTSNNIEFSDLII